MPTVEQLSDLVTLTLAELGEMKITDNMLPLRNYVAASEVMKKSRMTVESGDSIEFSYAYQDSGAAKHTQIGETDTVNMVPLAVRGSLPWRFSTTNYFFDTREQAMNSGKRRIFDVIKLRRAGSIASWYGLAESTFWSKPTDSTDTKTPFGVDYWITGYSGTPGFQGGNPTGFSSGRAGIDSSTYPRFKNWAGTYTSITRADLVAKLRKASYSTGFQSPLNLPEYRTGTDYGYYTTYDVVSTLETIVEGQNENLGNDVAAKDGTVLFRGNKVVAVPYLTENTSTNPIYGIDWGTFKTVVKSGEWMNESKPITPPYRHREVIIYVDFQYNFVCYDPRRNFKLNQ